MRIAVFVDGRSFYGGWRAANRPRIHFPSLAAWLVESVGGDGIWGVHYYTAVESGEAAETPSQEALRAYLEMLDAQPGYFVRRFRRRTANLTCPSCGDAVRLNQDREVDTALVADMLYFASVDAYDAAVLVSSDIDHTPALAALRSMGKQTWVASWGRGTAPRRLRQLAFDHIDLLENAPAFTEAGDGPEPAAPARAEEPDYGVDDDVAQPAPGTWAPTPDAVLDTFVSEVARAQAKFQEGYVGLHYFLTRWKSDTLDTSADARRRVLDAAVAAGRVEIYEAGDGAKALRTA